MKRSCVILIGVALFSTTAYCDDTAYKQSDVYKKAIKKYDKHCPNLDAVHITALRERAKNQAEQGWTKGAMLKDARKFSQEKGLDQEFNRCLVAIVYLERAPVEYATLQEKIRKNKLQEEHEAKIRKKIVVSLTEKEIAWVIYKERKGIKYLSRKTPRTASSYRGGQFKQISSSRFAVGQPGQPSSIVRLPKIAPAVGVFAKIIEEIIIVQVVDKNHALVQYGERYFWLKTNTESYVDGTQYRTNKVHLVTGTHQYTTTLGQTNTVFIIEPLELDYNKISLLDDIAIQQVVDNNP